MALAANRSPQGHSMLDRVAKHLQKKGLVRDGDRVLCMVSGGADSVAMLHLLDRVARKTSPHFPDTFSLGICHVNYGRRGAASELDEILVRRLGDSMGAPVHVIQAPRGQRANFQAWARDFRYLAAQNLCRWQGYTRIAVAHNQDDRIETFLYRLITYSGRRSLVVMPPCRGRVVRPLLFATAAEIREFCANNNLQYHNDDSNDTLDYARNQIRHLVTPRLQEIRPDFQEHILDTLSLLEDEDNVLEAITAEAWHTVCAAESAGDVPVLKAGELAAMPRAISRLLIRRWLAQSRTNVRLSRRLLDAITDLCADPSGTSFVSLSKGLQVERRYDRLMLVARAGTHIGAPAGAGEELPGDAQKDDADGGGVELSIPGKTVFGDYQIEVVESPGWELTAGDPLLATFDAANLQPPLIVRSWRPGDRFAPLGLGGSKSVQDLFTDEKVPQPERRRVPIVTSAGRIAWVCGLRVSEEFRVTGDTERTVGLKATRRAVERAV